MLPNLPTLGIRFGIDKLGTAAYGLAAWEVIWEAVDIMEIRLCDLYEGDSTATLEGKERVFCIAFQHLRESKLAYIRTALKKSSLFLKMAAIPAFVGTPELLHEPLSSAGRIDSQGKFSGPEAHNPMAAWNAVYKRKQPSPSLSEEKESKDEKSTHLSKTSKKSLQVNCPGCSFTFTVSAKHAGKKARCKKCGQALKIPTSPSPSSSVPTGPSHPLSKASAPEIPLPLLARTSPDPASHIAKSRSVYGYGFGSTPVGHYNPLRTPFRLNDDSSFGINIEQGVVWVSKRLEFNSAKGLIDGLLDLVNTIEVAEYLFKTTVMPLIAGAGSKVIIKEVDLEIRINSAFSLVENLLRAEPDLKGFLAVRDRLLELILSAEQGEVLALPPKAFSQDLRVKWRDDGLNFWQSRFEGICDSCSKKMERNDGYILPPSEIADSWSYLEDCSQKFSTSILGMGMDKELFLQQKLQQIWGDTTNWLICNDCIRHFDERRYRTSSIFSEVSQSSLEPVSPSSQSFREIPSESSSDDSHFLIGCIALVVIGALALWIIGNSNRNRKKKAYLAKIKKRIEKKFKREKSRTEILQAIIDRVEDPKTPPETLKKLGDHRDARVRRAMARNPKCPVGLLKSLSKDEAWEVRAAAASNPGLPIEILRKLLHSPSPFVSQAAIRNPRCPPEWKILLEPLYRKKEKASQKNTSPKVLALLAREKDFAVRQKVAGNPSTPASALRELSGASEYPIRQEVAKNPSTPSEVLEGLLSDPTPQVQRALIDNPSTPSDILRKLKEKFPYLSYKIQQHPNAPKARKITQEDIDRARDPRTPPKVLRSLSKSDHRDLRKALAANPALPVEAQLTLAKSHDLAIRLALAEHPKLDSRTIELLLKDFNYAVRIALAKRTDLKRDRLLGLARDRHPKVFQAAFQNPGMDAMILKELSRDSRAILRRQVALHPKATKELLEALSKDRDGIVRAGVAENPLCSAEILTRLYRDKREVAQAVAGNPNTPGWILMELSKKGWYFKNIISKNPSAPLSLQSEERKLTLAKDPKTPAKVLSKLARDKNYRIRFAVAQNSQATSSTLSTLSRDENDSIRARVAEHKNTPSWVLSRLSRDKFSWVRRAVAKNSNTPQGVLKKLSRDSDPRVKADAREELQKQSQGK